MEYGSGQIVYQKSNNKRRCNSTSCNRDDAARHPCAMVQGGGEGDREGQQQGTGWLGTEKKQTAPPKAATSSAQAINCHPTRIPRPTRTFKPPGCMVPSRRIQRLSVLRLIAVDQTGLDSSTEAVKAGQPCWIKCLTRGMCVSFSRQML